MQGQMTVQESALQERLLNHFKILRVVKDLQLKTIAHRSGMEKVQGVEAFWVLIVLVFLTFLGQSIHYFLVNKRNELFKIGGKDVFYRFTVRRNIHWRRFLFELSFQVIKKFQNLSSWRHRVLIVDDTILQKHGKHIEELSWVYDHTIGKSVKGFNALVLGWSDRSSFIPIDFAVTGGKKKIQKNTENIQYDKRSRAWRRREEIEKDKVTLCLEMLERCKRQGLDAGAVLFDSWFCYPKIVHAIYEEVGYHVISMLKTISKLTVVIKNKVYSTQRLWTAVVPNLPSKIVTMNDQKVELSSIIACFGKTTVRLVFCKPIEKDKRS